MLHSGYFGIITFKKIMLQVRGVFFVSQGIFFLCDSFVLDPDALCVPSQHPYPSEEQKKQLSQDTGLTILQVNNWSVCSPAAFR